MDKINPNFIPFITAHANVSNKNPFSTFDNSVRTLENAWMLLDFWLKDFIYLLYAYGQFKKSTVNEDTICEPLGHMEP